MRVTPGEPIPFWFRLYDSNPSRFILAHLTETNGSPYPGSPFPLSYSGSRGIYTATGPIMGMTDLVVDYETYRDSGFTTLDLSYLPTADWIEPEIGGDQTIVITQVIQGPIQGKIRNILRFHGEVDVPVDAEGILKSPLLEGEIQTIQPFKGKVIVEDIEGKI